MGNEKTSNRGAAVSVIAAAVSLAASVAGVYVAARSNWREEAVLQVGDPLEFEIGAIEPGKVVVRNVSRLDAVSVEVERRRIFYSTSCDGIFAVVGPQRLEAEKLARFEAITLSVERPVGLKKALSKLPGRCRKTSDGVQFDKSEMDLTSFRDNSKTATTVHRLYGPKIDGGSEGWVPVCTERQPCRTVEFVRVRAVHSKAFSKSNTDEFFLADDEDWNWTDTSSLVSVTTSKNEFGSILDIDVTWRNPEHRRMFVRVANYVRDLDRQDHGGRETHGPFRGVGLWKATGVREP